MNIVCVFHVDPTTCIIFIPQADVQQLEQAIPDQLSSESSAIPGSSVLLSSSPPDPQQNTSEANPVEIQQTRLYGMFLIFITQHCVL